ncbi:MAG TPA: Wzz/FepE/Etk N-terminal domain-containing protein, partial [Longimicrobiales bacterium]|nr:Wzz/FepE/Etk N-terminal domain-containing protein [Longimicrobiales bacterium]
MADLIPYNGNGLPAARNDAAPLLAGYEPPAQEFELRQAFAILRRRAWLILSVTALALVVAGWLVFRQVPQYRASAVIRLIDQRGAMTSGIEVANQQVMGTTDDPLLSQIEVLRTRTLASRVVDRLGLRLRPVENARLALDSVQVSPTAPTDTLALEFADAGYTVTNGKESARAAYGQRATLTGVSFMIAARPSVGEATLRLNPREAMVDSLLRSLRARPREKTDVVDVEYTSPDPALSQQVVNTVIEEFQALNAHQAQEQSRRRRLFLEEQLAEMDSMQSAAQTELSEFRRREQVFSSRDKFTTEQAGLTGLEVRRQELVAERRMFESLLDDLNRPRRPDGSGGLLVFASSPEVSSNPVITTLFSQLLSYEAVRDSLTMGDYGRAATDPDVQRFDALITTTRSKLTNALRGHVGGLDARISALDNLRGRSSSVMQALPDAEAEEVRYVQNVETVRQMSDQLRGEYQKARIAEAVEGGQVEILDYAAVPERPVPARRAFKLALGLLVGLLLASGLAFAVEQMNTAIRA